MSFFFFLIIAGVAGFGRIPEGNYTLQLRQSEYITLECSHEARSSALNLTQLMYNFFRVSPASDLEYVEFMDHAKNMTNCQIKPDENDLKFVRLGKDPTKSLMVYFAGANRTLVHS